MMSGHAKGTHVFRASQAPPTNVHVGDRVDGEDDVEMDPPSSNAFLTAPAHSQTTAPAAHPPAPSQPTHPPAPGQPTTPATPPVLAFPDDARSTMSKHSKCKFSVLGDSTTSLVTSTAGSASSDKKVKSEARSVRLEKVTNAVAINNMQGSIN